MVCDIDYMIIEFKICGAGGVFLCYKMFSSVITTLVSLDVMTRLVRNVSLAQLTKGMLQEHSVRTKYLTLPISLVYIIYSI